MTRRPVESLRAWPHRHAARGLPSTDLHRKCCTGRCNCRRNLPYSFVKIASQSGILNEAGPEEVSCSLADQRVRRLSELHTLQLRVQSVHALLEADYLLGIGIEDRLQIYRRTHAGYSFVDEYRVAMLIPESTCAAFPVPQVNDAVAVLTDVTLNERYGLISALHEFVHCFQYRECEDECRRQLPAAWEARKESMWEIQYGMDYENLQLRKLVYDLGRGAKRGVLDQLKRLLRELGDTDQQYFLWQVWKEGFARYVENRVRSVLHVRENTEGRSLDRVDRRSLYFIGDKVWRELDRETKYSRDIRDGFDRLLELRAG